MSFITTLYLLQLASQCDIFLLIKIIIVKYHSPLCLFYGYINVKNEHIASTLIVTNSNPYLEPSLSKKISNFSLKILMTVLEFCVRLRNLCSISRWLHLCVYHEWTLYFINVFLHTALSLFLQFRRKVDWTIYTWNAKSALHNRVKF